MEKEPSIKDMGNQNTLDYGSITRQVKFLQGKILTIVDATFGDKEQKKAVKDLVNHAFSEQLSWIAGTCFPEVKMTTRECLEAQGVDVDAIERGAVTSQ